MKCILSMTASFLSFTNIKLNDNKTMLLSFIAKSVQKGRNNPSDALLPKDVIFTLLNSQQNKVALQPYNKSIHYLEA